MNKEYDFHPLTVKIKDYFASDENNAFSKRLRSIIAVERIEVFPDEPDDEEVIIVFGENDNHLSCIVFSNGRAWIECESDDKFFNIPFYYTRQSEKKNYILDGTTWFDIYSVYDNYESKSIEKLLDDILAFMENILLKKVFVEYLGGGKRMFKKSRIYLYPNKTIAYTRRWQDKYLKNKKLKTVRL
jgi:hypothetical protein